MAELIRDSVGLNGKNNPDDAGKIQSLLNSAGMKPALRVDRTVGAITIAAIRTFQAKFMQQPDGRVDPGGRTLAELNKYAGNIHSPHTYHWPLAGHIRVTCEFGSHDKMHNDKKHPHGHGGMDLGAAPGTHVLAARDGRVLHSGTADGYGHWVVLRHADGQLSIYGHLSSHHLAHEGKVVKAGDVIGIVGTASEGHTTGPHLHFQINKANSGVRSSGAMNPRLVLSPPT